MKLTLITVTYGEATRAKALVQSLLRFPPPCDWQLILVDNGSPKAVTSQLREIAEGGNITLIPLRKNMGYGAAINEAAAFAKGEIIGILNPDIEATEKTWEPLLAFLQQYPRSIIAPQLVAANGDQLQNARPAESVWSLVAGRFASKKMMPQPKKPTAVEWIQGSFMLMRREIFAAVVGFDDRFFLFFEDTDLCRTAWEKDIPVILVPDATAIHGTERLSGNGISLFKKTFWIHIHSALKYWRKWGAFRWSKKGGLFSNFDYSPVEKLSQTHMKDLILLGKQGSGKGTQGKILAEKWGYQIFETGAELRAIAASDTDLGREVKEITERGDLVSNEIVMRIVANFIGNLDGKTPVIFDGIPRSEEQRASLEAELEKANRSWQPLLIHLTDKEAMRRLLSRGTAADTGAVFGVASTAPKRADDNEAGIARRLQNFAKHTQPLIDNWGDRGLLISVNGEQEPAAVTTEVMSALGLS